MQRLNQAFKAAKSIEPPASLEAAILCNIKNVQTKQVRRKLLLSQIGSFGSAFAVVYTLFVFGATLLRSEFWTMLSLAFTDAGVVFSNWDNFFYSVMETFPVLALAMILLPVFFLFASISSYLSVSDKNNFKHIHHGACV